MKNAGFLREGQCDGWAIRGSHAEGQEYILWKQTYEKEKLAGDRFFHEKENRELIIAKEAVSKLNDLWIPEVIGHDIERTLNSIMLNKSKLTLQCLCELVGGEYAKYFTRRPENSCNDMNVLECGDEWRRIFSRLSMSTMHKIGWPSIEHIICSFDNANHRGTMRIRLSVSDLTVLTELKLKLAREAIAQLNKLHIPDCVGYDIMSCIAWNKSRVTLYDLYNIIKNSCDEHSINRFSWRVREFDSRVPSFDTEIDGIFCRISNETLNTIGWTALSKEKNVDYYYVSNNTVNIVFPFDDLEVLK